MIRFLLIFWFICYSLRHGVLPWRFFQLNAPYFNLSKGIFSKLDIDKCIPSAWLLPQVPFCPEKKPRTFPVFLKPEWGQNSHGIFRADTLEEFQDLCQQIEQKDIDYIVQGAALETREFEAFYIRSASGDNPPATLSLTEVINTGSDFLPINGIYNEKTVYHDCTDQFSLEDQGKLWQHFKSICDYRLARVGLRTNSKEDFIKGNFHIIEINLFLPMPLSLLDKKMSMQSKVTFIKKAMENAALAVKSIPADQEIKSVFFKKMAAHYKLTS